MPPLCVRSLFWLAGSALVFAGAEVSARPLHDGVQRRQSDNKGDASGGDNSSNTMSASQWIPILVVAVVLAILVAAFCIRRSMSRRSPGAGAGATNTTEATAGAQGASRPQPRAGRRRRPRRTPSQISTKSLPPYMKEPGEQELVIIRGPSEMEDDVTNVMPVVEEGDERPETRATHHDLSLDRVESHDTLPEASSTDLIRSDSREVPIRPSMDAGSLGTSHSQESTSSLLEPHLRLSAEDPRGEAPPYFEVVGDGDQNGVVNLNDTPAVTVSVPPTNAGAPDRRSRQSGLFSLFNAFSSSSRPSPPVQQGRSPTPSSTHTRDASGSSGRHRSHHPSHSGSGSISALSSSALRSLRLNGNNNPMTSPSTISVDSISAPLSHTLTRSEFRAPKGGLTPEQIKLITSRGALERFGVPYGPDAVAFSASQLSMAAPPPDFDSSQSQTSALHGRSGTSDDNMTERRTESPFSIMQAVGQSSTAASSPERGLATHSPSASIHGRSPSIPTGLYPPSSYQPPRAASRASTVMTYATAAESVSSDSDGPTTPVTARPLTPPTARPFDQLVIHPTSPTDPSPAA
ncbi:hypothetical protein BV22DRAFT_1129086 [Leucogyrophana mollusca]|uniref:Uncharacterized protein n=1 Tax=Leucogyrophana mollusca TaxID=85980 RepID=A0ACB8BL99_9AGAM|nr:hypothetical protein BV22DRAFT_1129086 [Leucogyrophana mollusca]